MKSKVKGRPLLVEYRGEHQDAIDFLFGFKARLIANDFHGHAEVFYYEVIQFEKLAHSRDLVLSQDGISAKEKLTQLLIAADHLKRHLSSAETQVSKKEKPRFELNDNYFQILNQAELVIFKLAALLDILAKVSAQIFGKRGVKNVPPKYGQQKAMNENGTFKATFDEPYQKRLLENHFINHALKYRHLSSHERSLKLLPYCHEGSWVLVLSDGRGEGFILRDLVNDLIMELQTFLDWFESNFEIG